MTGELITDREPLHDIPELWGPDERAARAGDLPEGSRFPTPRPLSDGPLGDGPLSAARADTAPLSGHDLGVLGGHDPGLDEAGANDLGLGDRDVLDPAREDRPAVDRSSRDRGEDQDFDGSRNRGFGHHGLDRDPGPGGVPDRDSDGGLDGLGLGGRSLGSDPLGSDPLGSDPLDALVTARGRIDVGPAPGSLPDPDPVHDEPWDGDRMDSDGLGPDPLDRDGPDGVPPHPDLVEQSPSDREPRHRDVVDDDPLATEQGKNQQPPAEDPLARIRALGRPHRSPTDRVASGSGSLAQPRDREPLDRNPLDRADRSRADRSRHDGDRSDYGPLERHPLAPEPRDQKPPADPVQYLGAARAPDPFGRDPLGRDEFDRSPLERAALDRQPGEPFGAAPDDHDRSGSEPLPHEAVAAGDRFADPALADSVHTGRIQLGDGHGRSRPAGDAAGGTENGSSFDQGAPGTGPTGGDAVDPTPDPTTVFRAVGPTGPGRRGAPEESAAPLHDYAAWRRAAELAAASAEEAAASAAERASAAIAAAARAAEEAEAAADAAVKAAQEAHEAAEAEVRAIADAVARGETPGQQVARAEEPEPPTQAVPLITPAGPPNGRPLQRPVGPLPRPARPDEPERAPRAAHRAGSLRDSPSRDSTPRDSAARRGTDGEATAVLTGLQGLRGHGRSRGPDPADAEATSVVRRRSVAEPVVVDGPDEADEAGPEEAPVLARRLTTRPVLAAVGVAVVLAVAAVVATLTATAPDPAPTATTPAAVTEPVAVQPVPPAAPDIEPNSEKAIAFLAALRAADIPVSSSGQAETEAAAAICAQLDQGADEAQLARSVPAVLPNVTRGQASDVVDHAEQHYC
jgi:hypothetical protein